MKNKDIRLLINKYGEDITLKQILESQNLNYVCPKCNGLGVHQKILIDGIWGKTEDVYQNVDCNICHGQGYTSKEIKPKYKTELIGYE